MDPPLALTSERALACFTSYTNLCECVREIMTCLAALSKLYAN